MKKLTLQRTYALEEHRAYAVHDHKGLVLGFLASMKRDGKKFWAYAYVESEFARTMHYRWVSRKQALDMLVSAREVKADTGAITVIRTPKL